MYIQNGDLVRIKRSFIGSKPNCLGYVYDTYPDFDDSSKTGVSIITDDGIDLGGFSYREQKEFLEFVSHTDLLYNFKNVIKLSNDFDEGYFKDVF